MNEGYIEIRGTVGTVIYQNEENAYTVLRLDTKEGGSTTAVGCIPFVTAGEPLVLRGNWTNHPSHGTQFKAEEAVRLVPESTAEIYNYLSSGAIKSIGPSTAKQIVSAFMEDSLRIIEERPEELCRIKGISKKRALEINESYKRQTGIRRLMGFFSENGLKLQYAMRLYRLYGDDAKAALQDNPYLLIDEYFGADFSEADKLALSLGFEADSIERINAAVIFELMHNAGNGHCFIPVGKLEDAVASLIKIPCEPVSDALIRLQDSGSVVAETIAGIDVFYLRSLYDAEVYVAKRIMTMTQKKYQTSYDPLKLIESSGQDMGIILAEGQQRAVICAGTNGIMALTGGPGTGKTTTVRAVLELYDRMGLKTALTAPTGRAAKRLSELCGREASTIHRLLETGYDPESGELVFTRDETEPLNLDAIILDEASMVDLILMRALLAAMKDKCRLVLVGDADQLPSVGPGHLFGDIIKSGAVETVSLTEIFRQAEKSTIVTNAHKINKGELPDTAGNDFFFLKRSDMENAAKTIEDLCLRRLPQNMGIMPDQIQVLSPTRLYTTGTVELNKRLQNALNPPDETKKERKNGEITFRTGDKVMQIRNNYDIIWKRNNGEIGSGVFNGDIGYIADIDLKEQILVVDYEDKLVNYSFDMLSDLEPAYAMTVHKSQGSEYRAVILSLAKCPPSLLSRAVLYTAVTRAKELLIIVGDSELLRIMTQNNRPQRRYSGLRFRLQVKD